MFRPKAKSISMFDGPIVKRAIGDSFRKLAPQHVARNPVMFVVEIGSVLTTLILVRDIVHRASAGAPLWFTVAVTVWLWFTVVFANFAEAVAEGRGKAQADTLRKMRKETTARRLAAAIRRARKRRSRRRRCAKATWWWWRWASSSPATARSSKASPRWTSRPSPANPRP